MTSTSNDWTITARPNSKLMLFGFVGGNGGFFPPERFREPEAKILYVSRSSADRMRSKSQTEGDCSYRIVNRQYINQIISK